MGNITEAELNQKKYKEINVVRGEREEWGWEESLSPRKQGGREAKV